MNKETESFQFLVALPTPQKEQLDTIAKETGTSRVAVVRSAIEMFLAERGGEKLSIELPEDLRIRLAAFVEAFYGATVQLIVADALQRHIDRFINDNPDIKERFEEAHKQIVASGNVEGGSIVVFPRTRVS